MTPHSEKLSVLFVLKKRTSYWGEGAYTHKSSGLFNSANFVNHMLKHSSGIESHLVEVVDNNCIDREVTNFDPDVVILEAIWVTPEKVRELAHLHRHRHRRWIVRNHSELPFLAMEGISLQWLLEYSSIKHTYVSNNSLVANDEIALLIQLHKGIDPSRVLYLPNYFPTHNDIGLRTPHHKNHLDISCFGAIRPLKNTLEQAVAAIMYAKSVNRPLRFHINATRIEGKAEPILKSLKAIFNGLEHYQLIEHSWLDRKDFLKLCKTMDVGLQVSFSETFNIVSADHVIEGVPCVTSDEVPWMPKRYHALPVSAEDIAKKISIAINDGPRQQLRALQKYAETSKHIWFETLDKITP